MPPRNVCKSVTKVPKSNTTNTINSTITLREEEPLTTPIAPFEPSLTAKSSYPLRPLLLTLKQALQDTQETIDLTNNTQLKLQANKKLEVAIKEEKLS